ncbi:MAG: MotA/TolQ/ExbB proton channel family protein [Deltaproteobacteria bacterium]|jgi:biopolymer transport protein ExbB/TolQ|nr:MotA/TolQ/ExbB proton channel family protein [Deltaproteobacteria bacterium]
MALALIAQAQQSLDVTPQPLTGSDQQTVQSQSGELEKSALPSSADEAKTTLGGNVGGPTNPGQVSSDGAATSPPDANLTAPDPAPANLAPTQGQELISNKSSDLNSPFTQGPPESSTPQGTFESSSSQAPSGLSNSIIKEQSSSTNLNTTTSSGEPDHFPALAAPAPHEPAVGGGQPLAASVGIVSPPQEEMSIKNMFLDADPVVQGVMVILLLASMATWMVIFEKIFVLIRALKVMNRFKKVAIDLKSEINIDEFPPMTSSIVKSGLAESRDSVGRESRADFRERMEKAMKTVLMTIMRRLSHRSLVLATIGSVSPFVGLFGTVWGIMDSFIGIASSGETTLAVVAPGIAEALFATAMGLVAAIPAVIGYNKVTSSIKEIALEGMIAVSLVGNHLARLQYGRMEERKYQELNNG